MPSLRALLGSPARLRLALGGGAVVVVVATFAACGGCGKRLPEGEAPISKQSPSDGGAASARIADAVVLREPLMWEHARSGEVEDLASLAAHEGAAGLGEALADPQLRPTAIRAMGYARGWAQIPVLAKLGAGKDDEEATLALDSVVELAMRPRRAEDPEDAEELREGCQALLDLASDSKKARSRRVLAVRALRAMPCPPDQDGGIPRDVDSK